MGKWIRIFRSRGQFLVLAAIVLLGGWLRLTRLDLMEFKRDERQLHQLAVKQAGGEWQLGGLMSSVGVRNPPMAVYLFALPALINPNPVLMACLPALLSTATIALSYALARNWLSRGASLAAALLFAVSPWAVVESRKIWAQDLLPFFAALFFLLAVQWLRKGGLRRAIGMAVALAALNQIHYSSLALWPVVAFLIWRRRSRETLRQALIGAAVFAALWMPFIVLVLRGEAKDPREYVASPRESRAFPREFARAVLWQGRLMDHGGFETLLGDSTPDFVERATPFERLTVVFLVLLLGGMVAASWRARRQPELWLLILWLILPMLLAVHGMFFHYLIVCYPASFLVVGLLGDVIWNGFRAFAWKAALVGVFILALGVLTWEQVRFTVHFFDFVSDNGGALGDYGPAYRDKLRVAEFLKEQVPDGAYSLVDYTQRHRENENENETYEYLYRLAGGRGREMPLPARDAPPAAPVFVVLGTGAEGEMRADPRVLRSAGTVSLGALRVQRLLPVARREERHEH